MEIKKTAFFRYVKRLGMTTVGMPWHGFTFPVEGIVPVIFSSMGYRDVCFLSVLSLLCVLTDLKNMAVCQEWDKQVSIFKGIYLENHVSHNEF